MACTLERPRPNLPQPLIASGGNTGSGPGADMSPRASAAAVKAAFDALPDKIPAGPFQPTWDSLQKNYQIPQRFVEAKFGIFCQRTETSTPVPAL